MSIETITAFRVKGQIYEDIQSAQIALINDILDDSARSKAVVDNADKIISILQWNGESAPAKKTRKTRKDKGTKRGVSTKIVSDKTKPAVVEGSGKYEGK